MTIEYAIMYAFASNQVDGGGGGGGDCCHSGSSQFARKLFCKRKSDGSLNCQQFYIVSVPEYLL